MEDREEFKKGLAFFNAACDACKNNYSAEFICPRCGGIAQATKSKYNGHVWANCEGCGFQVMQ
jgi:predicted RNA-binding Zn-ribbon protein involved in translation (DUF1610 family)